MEWTETAPPITIMKHNITLPDYVLVDFTATSVRRVCKYGNILLFGRINETGH